MSFLKKIFNKTSETFRELIKKFPVTLLIIAFATVFLTIAVDSDFSTKTIGKVCLFCTIFAVESFLIENIFDKRKIYKGIGYALAAIIALVFNLLIFSDKSDNFVQTTVRILIGYLLIVFLYSIYVIIRKNKIEFRKYLLNVFANMFNSTITYLVLNLGLTLISVIFIELLLDSEYGLFIVRLQILLLGLFYIPQIINSLWNITDKNINTFIQGLIKFVLLPLTEISMLIIYMYIVKILVLNQMPSNIIFRILAGIFIVAFPVWNMAENFKEDSKFVEKSVKLLPYFYMPFILLECYSLYVRIAELGFTPVRYFGIVFIMGQIIALILTITKKGEKLPHIFLYIACLTLIAFITPINYYNVSVLSQKNILVNAFPETLSYKELSQENRSKVKGAYRFLVRNDAFDYIPEYIKEYSEEIYSYVSYNNIEYIHVYDGEVEIAISNYSKLIEVSESTNGMNTKFEFYGKYNNLIARVDLKELIENAVNTQDPEQYIIYHRIIKIDDTKDLYIKRLNASYYKDTKTVQNISIDGFILFR